MAAEAKRRRRSLPLEHGRESLTGQAAAGSRVEEEEAESTAAERRASRRAWAQLIRRNYEVDPLVCDCGSRMDIISFILEPKVIVTILWHLEAKGRHPGRAPPTTIRSGNL